MKNVRSKLVWAMLALFFVGISTQVLADDKSSQKANKALSKAEKIVENAGPNDWAKYAKAAEICLKQGEHLQEALNWAEQSIAIQSNPRNLMLKGDIYAAKKDKRNAMAAYVEAIEVGKKQSRYFDTSELQSKISETQKLN